MKLFKVHFEYPETGYIPNIVAPDEDAAVEGAKMMLTEQGVVITKILKVEEISPKEKETLN